MGILIGLNDPQKSGGGGSNIQVLEGDLVTKSASNGISITHNLGVTPLYFKIYITSSYTIATNVAVEAHATKSFITEGGDLLSLSLVLYYNSSGTIAVKSANLFVTLTETLAGVGDMKLNASFPAGTYHYKVYYEK